MRDEEGHVLKLAALLNNPCTAPLTAPEYGSSDSGYLMRFHSVSSHTLAEGGARSSGYVVFFPDYHGNVGSSTQTVSRNASIVGFADASGTSKPTNDTTDPAFASADLTSQRGGQIADPGYPFISGDVVQDARTVAACMQMTYTGSMQNIAGRVGTLENVTREMLITGNSGDTPTIDQMMSLASSFQRTPTKSCEVKYRPSENGKYFRTEGDLEEVPQDACLATGVPGSTASSVVAVGGASSGAAHGIGFVWIGLPDDGSSLVFDFYKAIEWRPECSDNIVMPAPHSFSPNNLTEHAVAALDRHHPGWTRKAADAGEDVAGMIAKLAFGGNPIPRSLRAPVRTLYHGAVDGLVGIFKRKRRRRRRGVKRRRAIEDDNYQRRKRRRTGGR